MSFSANEHFPTTTTPPAAPLPVLMTHDPNEDFTPPTAGRLAAARVVISASIILTVAALATVFYRSFAVIEPTSAVVVVGDPSLDGAEISVTPDAFSSDYPESFATLSPDNNYQTPILLRPGTYWITITHKEHLILRDKFPVEAYKGQQYLLGEPARKAEAAKKADAAGKADAARKAAARTRPASAPRPGAGD